MKSEKIKKGRFEFSDNQALSSVGPNTRMALEKTRTKATGYTDPAGRRKIYTKKEPKHKIYFNYGCDFLEYNIAIRPYIRKKYNIKEDVILDALCFLYPKQIFTMPDFNMMGLKNHNIYLKHLKELNLVELSVKDKGVAIYKLTKHAINIVKDYYMHLSGERVLNPKSSTNPFNAKGTNRADKLKETLMLRLRNQSEKNPSRFRNALFKKD